MGNGDNTYYAIVDFETTGLDPKKDYPIEIGMIITDHEFSLVHAFDALIKWDKLIGEIGDDTEWPEEYQKAAEVHNISASEYKNKSEPYVDSDVRSKIARYTEKGSRVVMISDNTRFEWAFMEKLLNERALNSYVWPFHHSAWDCKLLMQMAGVEPPKKPHRAFKDAALLYRTILECEVRTRGLRNA